MSSPTAPSPFDDLLRELDELPSAAPAAPFHDEKKAVALQRLMEASKLLESVAASLDPSGPKHPLHGVAIPEEAKARLQKIVERLMEIQKKLHVLEDDLIGERSPEKESPPLPDTPSPAFIAAKAKLDQERAAFASYKAQWEAAFLADPAQREAHPEVLAYYEQMERYFTDHEAYLKTL